MPAVEQITTLTVRVPTGMRDALERQATAQGDTLATVVRAMLRQALGLVEGPRATIR